MGCIGSCFGAICANCFCGAVGNICKPDSKNARSPYIITFLAWALSSFLFALIPTENLDSLPFVDNSAICVEACGGNGAIYRIGLCLVIFFSLHFAVLLIPGTGCFHWRVYMLKLLGLVAITIWSFWWSNEIADNFANVARWFSWLFIVIQGYMLICWAYDTHDAMLARMDGSDGAEAEPNVKWGYLAICVVMQVGSIALLILFFGQYAGTGCSDQKATLSITLVMGILATGISSTEWCEHGNLFVSSIMMFYFTYLNFQSLATATAEECQSSWSEHAPMWIGFIVLVFALSYVGYMGISSDEKAELQGDEDIEKGEAATEHHNSPSARKVNCWFHFGMLLGSFYVTMVLSNWGDTDRTSSGYKANTWIIASGEWVAMAMYVWTLVAPMLLKDRDFGF